MQATKFHAPISFFTARRYISAVLAVVVCPSACPSQAGIIRKRLDESSWFLARRLPSTCHTVCKEIWVSPKTRILQRTWSQTPDLENLVIVVVSLLYTTCFYSWQDFDWHVASRGPAVEAQILVVQLCRLHQRWTWVESIHRLGWVGSHFSAHAMGWVDLVEWEVLFFSLHFVFVVILCAKKISK